MKKFTYIDRPFEPLIDAKEAAKYLGFSVKTVCKMARNGRLPSFGFPMGRSGKHLHRFRVSELKTYLASLKRGPLSVSVESSDDFALRAG